MAPTREIAWLGEDLPETFLKAILAACFRLPERRQVLLTIGSLRDKTRLLPSARLLRDLRFTLYATRHTSRFLEDHGVANIRLYKIHERRKPSLLEYITRDRLDLIINVPAGFNRKELTDGYIIRRRATDVGIPLITNLQLAELFVKSIAAKPPEDLHLRAYDEYVRANGHGAGERTVRTTRPEDGATSLRPSRTIRSVHPTVVRDSTRNGRLAGECVP